MVRKFRIIKPIDRGDLSPAVGSVWQEYHECNYGLKADDERHFGEEHVVLSRDGKTPFITAPVSAVEEVEA